MKLPDDLLSDLIDIKKQNPLSVVFVSIDKETGELSISIRKTKHVPNRLTKEGYFVKIIELQATLF